METSSELPAASSNSSEGNAVAEPSGASALSRMAVPLFLFSLSLAGLLALSRVFLVPRLTRVEVSGEIRRAADLQALRTSLLSQIRDEEKKRDQILLPIHDPAYTALKALRGGGSDPSLLRAQILDQATSLSPVPDAVSIESFRYDPVAKRIELSGSVRSVGARSMTVLSQFVSMVGRLPIAASVTQPRYARVDGPDGPHSPFTFALLLR